MKYNSENLELLTESAWGKELLLRVLLLFLAAAYSYWKIMPCLTGCAAILKLFRRFLKALHFAGYMKEYEGTEPDFAEQLCKILSEIPEEQTKEAVRITGKAAFGREEPSAEEEDALRLYCRRAGRLLKTRKKGRTQEV